MREELGRVDEMYHYLLKENSFQEEKLKELSMRQSTPLFCTQPVLY